MKSDKCWTECVPCVMGTHGKVPGPWLRQAGKPLAADCDESKVGASLDPEPLCGN